MAHETTPMKHAVHRGVRPQFLIAVALIAAALLLFGGAGKGPRAEASPAYETVN